MFLQEAGHGGLGLEVSRIDPQAQVGTPRHGQTDGAGDLCQSAVAVLRIDVGVRIAMDYQGRHGDAGSSSRPSTANWWLSLVSPAARSFESTAERAACSTMARRSGSAETSAVRTLTSSG